MAGEKNSKYRPEYDKQAYKLCLLGATDKRIADFFEVSEKTLNTWKGAHPSFLQSLREGKILANANVASSLYNRAMGYSHSEEKVFCFQGEIITHETVKHYPPDTGAISLFLKNREPDLWRDKVEQVITLSDDFGALVDDAADD